MSEAEKLEWFIDGDAMVALERIGNKVSDVLSKVALDHAKQRNSKTAFGDVTPTEEVTLIQMKDVIYAMGWLNQRLGTNSDHGCPIGLADPDRYCHCNGHETPHTGICAICHKPKVTTLPF